MFPEHVSLVFLTTSHLLVAEKTENLDILVSKINIFIFLIVCLIRAKKNRPECNYVKPCFEDFIHTITIFILI